MAPVEETLSDLSDMDMEEFIVHDDTELKTKTEMWDTVNKDWLEAQELKKAQLEEAHQVKKQAALLRSLGGTCIEISIQNGWGVTG